MSDSSFPSAACSDGLPTPVTTRLLDGKAFADAWMLQLQQEHQQWQQRSGRAAGLAVVQVGADAASSVYVRKKGRTAEQLGFHSITHTLSDATTEAELLAVIEELNADASVDAILVQLPLPKHLDAGKVQQAVRPEKDVDGFHPTNLGLLTAGLQPHAVACTPAGIMRFLDAHKIPLKGKHAVVLGRSNIVGKPMALLLLQANATVTLCHSHTQQLAEQLKQADILIAALGRPHFVTADMLKAGAVVVDVGINRLEDGRLVGDVDFEAVAPLASAITPVPGGVGPLTIAQLMQNTFQLAVAASGV